MCIFNIFFVLLLEAMEIQQVYEVLHFLFHQQATQRISPQK